MSGRRVSLGSLGSLGIGIALLVAGAGAIVAACYDVPRPDCGFLCGPENACPDSYSCADDHYCHRLGTPAALVCSTDAGTSGDAGDARGNDAPSDAGDDAASDAGDDAASDAGDDAATDAP